MTVVLPARYAAIPPDTGPCLVTDLSPEAGKAQLFESTPLRTAPIATSPTLSYEPRVAGHGRRAPRSFRSLVRVRHPRAHREASLRVRISQRPGRGRAAIRVVPLRAVRAAGKAVHETRDQAGTLI